MRRNSKGVRVCAALLFATALTAGGWVSAMPRGNAQVCVLVEVLTTSTTVRADGSDPCHKDLADHDCLNLDKRPTARVVACWPVIAGGSGVR